ncbi:hypothetical protein ACWGI0_06635 [Streptomyces sp. NPDC054802]
MGRMRVLLLDAAPGELLDRELERLLGHGAAVTLNLRRVADRASARAAWTDRVEFADFDAFDESVLIAETVRDRLGRSPLFGLSNALLTPHVAGMTRRAMAEAALRCADHIAALLTGRPEGVPVVTP